MVVIHPHTKKHLNEPVGKTTKYNQHTINPQNLNYDVMEKMGKREKK